MKTKIAILLLFFTCLTNKANHQEKVDMIVFSRDRAMQLYAFFESINKYIDGLGEIWLIYRTSDERNENAYQSCFANFPNLKINKIKQSNEDANNSFKETLLNTIKSTNNKHILFAVDDIVVKDHVDLKRCVDILSKTNAYGFYLRLGKNITQCYTEGISTPVPECEKIEENGENIFLFSFKGHKGDWGYPCSVDMTIYDKEKIIDSISKINFTSPNRFESNWHVNEWFFNPNKDKNGLFFEKSKIVNIPLNVVQTDFISRNMGVSQNQLLEKFESGLKIDINPFFRIDNNAPHMEHNLTYVSRFPINELFDDLNEKNFEKIEKLEKEYPNINIYNAQDQNGYTPLIHGCNIQRLDIVKFLLSKNIDVNKGDKNNSTALIFAAWRGNLEIVDLLIRHGANVDATDINGTSALTIADKSNSPQRDEIITLLIEKINI